MRFNHSIRPAIIAGVFIANIFPCHRGPLSAAPIFITTSTTSDPAPRTLNISGTYRIADSATLIFANGLGATGTDGGVFLYNTTAALALHFTPDGATDPGTNLPAGAGAVVFQNNSTGKQGGAIAITNNKVLLTLVNATFAGNRTDTGNGGALITNGTSRIHNAVFISNTSGAAGGAFYNTGNSVITRTRLDGNRSTTTGGAIHHAGNILVFTGGTFSGNTAATNGGALYNTGANTSSLLTDVLFSQNEAAAGGAVYANSGTVSIFLARFEGNAAISSHGGAVYSGTAATILTDAIFTGNISAGNGGAIYTNRGILTIRATTSATNTGNKASGATNATGGFLYITGSGATVNFDITGSATRYVIGDAGAADRTLDTIASGGSGAAATGHTIIKTGDGTLVLNADNSAYRGAVNISAGALLLGNAAAKLNAAAFTLTGGALGGQGTLSGTFDFLTSSTLFVDAGLLTITTTATTGVTLCDDAVIGGSGTLALTGANNMLNLGSGVIAVAVAASETLAVTAAFAGDGALEKRDAGLLLLTNTASTFTGGVTLSGGTLAIDNTAQLGPASGGLRFASTAAAPATLRIDAAAQTLASAIILAASSTGVIDTQGHTLTHTGALVSDAAGTLIKTGAGALNIAGDAAAFAGTLRVDQGALVVSATHFAGGISLAPDTHFETGNMLAIGGTLASDNATLSFTLYAGAASGGFLNSDRIYASAITATGSNTIDIRGFVQTGTYNLGNLAPLASTARLTVDGAEQLSDFRRKATLSVSGSLLLVETQVDMSRALYWTGATGNIWTGALAGQWTDTGTVTRFADGDRVIFQNAAVVTIVNPVTVSDISVIGGGAITFTGAAITADATSVVSGTLTGAIGRLHKTGSGSLVFENAANTFRGGITLEEGAITFSRAAQLGTAGQPIAITGNATISLAADSGETELAAPIVISHAKTATLHTAAGSALVLRGFMTGSGGLAKTGPGALTFAAPASYTGDTRVESGVLRAAAPDAFASDSHFSVSAGGVLDLAGHNQTIASLTTHGLVDLGAARLSIVGNYTAASATLRLSIALSDTAAPQAGTLAISGPATGKTAISIQLTDTRATAGRSPLPAGMPALVTTAAASPGDAFALAGNQRLVVGAYDYLLLPVSIVAAHEWRLVLDNFSPEIPAVAGTDAIAIQSGRAAFDTLLARFDDLRVSSRDDMSDRAFDVWADVFYRRDRINGTVYTGASIDITGLQAGAGLVRKSGSRVFRFGVFADMSGANMQLSRGAKTEAVIRGAGLYATAAGRRWHIDAIVRGAKTSHDISVMSAAAFSADGSGFGATLQTGRVFDTRSGWRIEPLAALAWQRHALDDATDSFGRIYKVDDFSGIAVRVAVAFDRAYPLKRGLLIPRVRLGALHELDGKSRVTVGGDTIEADFGGLGAEIDAGIVWRVNNHWSFTAATSARAGSQFDGYSLRLGASCGW